MPKGPDREHLTPQTVLLAGPSFSKLQLTKGMRFSNFAACYGRQAFPDDRFWI